jgi:hypothetical protein
MLARYGGWGGDADIGLSEHAWLWDVPVLAVEGWEPAPTISDRGVRRSG